MSHFHVSVHLLLPPPDGFACLHTSSDGSGGDESVSKMVAEIETMAQAAQGNVEVGGASCLQILYSLFVFLTILF